MSLVLSGTAGVTYPDATIAASANVATSQLPIGSVVQVVGTTKTDTASTISTTFVDVPGLSVTITPTSSTSKILVTLHLHASCNNHATARLIRNSTPIVGATGGGVRLSSTLGNFYHGATSWNIVEGGVTYLDSPATTSATTYTAQWVTYAAANVLYLNRSHNDSDIEHSYRVISTITVMEIKA